MMFRMIATAALIFAGTGANAAESVYTTLNFDDGSCKTYGPPPTQEDEDLGVVALKCPGYKDYSVLYNSGDERTSVYFGGGSDAEKERGWESFESFNSTSEKIEWRLDDNGRPFAAILRYSLFLQPADPATGKGEVRGQVLVVFKVGQQGGPVGCAVGLVDALANKDANAKARQVADDIAVNFQCRKDTAVYHGIRGDKTSDFYAWWGD